jgi:hypothetical protein
VILLLMGDPGICELKAVNRGLKGMKKVDLLYFVPEEFIKE